MEQQEFKFCNYPGCQQPANPNFHDEKHGGLYCVSHCFRCDECGTLHGKQEETVLEFGGYREKKKYCKDCFDKNTMTQCPNCLRVIDKEEFLPPQKANSYTMKKGGCTNCASNCSACDKVIDNDDRRCQDDECYCEECFSENYSYCEECNNFVPIDDMVYIENHDTGMCSSCYKENYTKCYECDEEIEKSDATEDEYENYYCDKCAPLVKIREHKEHTDKFPSFTYTPKDRYLNQLQKLLPISVKKLKLEHASLAAGLNDLIAFSKGKDLNEKIVSKYRESLHPEEFPVIYQTWDGMQRSIDNLNSKPTKKDQLVLIVDIGKKLDITDNTPLLMLFRKINEVSKQSSHPSTPDMMGWARLEIDPNGEYILVDEIQSDHLGAIHSLKNDLSDDVVKIRETIKNNYQLSDEQFKVVLNDYYNLVKDFPQIANQAITKFAKENGFKKIYWHTYESGKELKKNEPPKSLYTKLPKEHFYNETEKGPFNLPGKFFEREARLKYFRQLTKEASCPEKIMLSGKL